MLEVLAGSTVEISEKQYKFVKQYCEVVNEKASEKPVKAEAEASEEITETKKVKKAASKKK